MITLFQVSRAKNYFDPNCEMLGYDDVFTRIHKCRAHYATKGLEADYVDEFIR